MTLPLTRAGHEALLVLADGAWHRASTGNCHGCIDGRAAKRLKRQGFAEERAVHNGQIVGIERLTSGQYEFMWRITSAGRKALAEYRPPVRCEVMVGRPTKNGHSWPCSRMAIGSFATTVSDGPMYLCSIHVDKYAKKEAAK